MKISEAQQEVKRILGKIEHPRLASYIALSEEVGEIADQIMKIEIYEEHTDKSKLAGEIADTMVALLELANVYQVDLEKELQDKFADLEPRAKKWEDMAANIIARKREKLN